MLRTRSRINSNIDEEDTNGNNDVDDDDDDDDVMRLTIAMSVILFPDSIKLIHGSFAAAAVSNDEAFSTMNSWEKLI